MCHNVWLAQEVPAPSDCASLTAAILFRAPAHTPHSWQLRHTYKRVLQLEVELGDGHVFLLRLRTTIRFSTAVFCANCQVRPAFSPQSFVMYLANARPSSSKMNINMRQSSKTAAKYAHEETTRRQGIQTSFEVAPLRSLGAPQSTFCTRSNLVFMRGSPFSCWRPGGTA